MILMMPTKAQSQIGLASWYGSENKVSCTGKRLYPNRLALAHKTIEIGSFVKVTNLKTKESIVAIVEDRGPYVHGRIADLNKPAAIKLGIITKGLEKVSIEKINNK
jgi:rare lipoprotein A